MKTVCNSQDQISTYPTAASKDKAMVIATVLTGVLRSDVYVILRTQYVKQQQMCFPIGQKKIQQNEMKIHGPQYYLTTRHYNFLI